MALTDERMDRIARVLCLPLMLVISFSLFQYLSLMYYRRRREMRAQVLLFFAFLGFASLVPFDHWDKEVVQHCNDISEACSTLTFLLQITIIGRDGNKKFKIRSLQVLTVFSEVLVFVDGFVISIHILRLISPELDLSSLDILDQLVENATLIFIFGFRFFYIAMVRGVRELGRNKKLEMFVYALFLTHEYPFLALENATGVSWEYVQGLYHRSLIVCCVALTIRDKLKTGNWRALNTLATSSAAVAPSVASRGRAESSAQSGMREGSFIAHVEGKKPLGPSPPTVPMNEVVPFKGVPEGEDPDLVVPTPQT